MNARIAKFEVNAACGVSALYILGFGASFVLLLCGIHPSGWIATLLNSPAFFYGSPVALALAIAALIVLRVARAEFTRRRFRIAVLISGIIASGFAAFAWLATSIMRAIGV